MGKLQEIAGTPCFEGSRLDEQNSLAQLIEWWKISCAAGPESVAVVAPFTVCVRTCNMQPSWRS